MQLSPAHVLLLYTCRCRCCRAHRRPALALQVVYYSWEKGQDVFLIKRGSVRFTQTSEVQNSTHRSLQILILVSSSVDVAF